MNWYLVDPKQLNREEEKNDGEKRNYLNKDEICKLDSKISNEFKKVVSRKKRNIISFTKKTHLKNYINFYNVQILQSNRESWFEESIKFFKKNDIIFLDPDNGLLKNKNIKNSFKHLLLKEITKYLSEEKIIIFTQFQSYNKNHIVYLDEIKEFLNLNGVKLSFPILRNRTSPNTFFITLGRRELLCETKILDIYKNFANEMQSKIELVTI